MRIIAITANLLLLAAFGFMVAKEGASWDAEATPLVLLIVAAPILSVIALMLRGVGTKDWLSGYFARKALEERRKLETLHDARLRADLPEGGTAASPGNTGTTEGPPPLS